jgi:glycosyltransferase involved in cell wall biosynthesis
MPKVAIIYNRFGPYHVARLCGAESVLAPRGLAALGIEVCPDDMFYSWSKVEDAVEVRRVPLFPGCAYGDISRRQIADSVRRVLDREQPEAVACPGWYYAEALAGAAWCRTNGKCAILMSESGRLDNPRVWWREWIKRLAIRRFDSALVGGRDHGDYLTELGMAPDRIAVGHNVVDNDWFARGSAEARRDADFVRQSLGLPKRYLLASGRFVREKNFARLLEAYRLYRESCVGKPLTLVLCGDGPLRHDLKALADTLGIAPHVHWPGFLQYHSLPACYGLAEAFILPSSSEPWGLVVNEAMASSLPVLVSRSAGCLCELMEEGSNGFSFDPLRAEEIAHAITRIDAVSGVQRESMGRRSREIIAAWGPERFGKGLWSAVQAAQAEGGRKCAG